MKEIENRRSIRKYLDRNVEDEKLNAMLESARLAPSGMNSQPNYYIVVRDEDIRKKLVEADHSQQWMMTAPVLIVVVADLACRIGEEIFIDENSCEPEVKRIIADSSIGITHILLEAESLGLGTCWTGWFEQKDIRPILGIPENKYVTGIITVGYADEAPDARPRKTLEEIVRYERW